MEICKTINENTTILVLDGSLDISSSQKLENELNKVKTQKIILDFEKLSYITSSGLRILLIERKRRGENNFECINVQPEVEKIFRLTGFDKLIKYQLVNFSDEFDFTNTNFVGLLKENVRRYPNQKAIVFLDRTYTWKDLDVGSQIIADKLSKMGVTSDDHVAIDGPNSINWYLTFFAIQKLGAVAILLNFALNPNEIAILSRASDITYLCYSEIPGKTQYDPLTAEVKYLSHTIKGTLNISPSIDFFKEINNYHLIENKFDKLFNPDDPSIVILTSGSTGVPKTILNSPYNIINLFWQLKTKFRFSENDYNLAFLPNFHVFGFLMNVVSPLLSAYPSFIPFKIKSDYLIDVIWKEKITVFNTVPTLILSMIQDPTFTKEKMESLRFTALAGAATTETQMKLISKNLPNNHLANAYGMSENPVISITNYGDTIEHLSQTVGKPLIGVDVEIRSPEGKVLHNGETGEIYVKSNYMIVSYYKLDEEEQILDEKGYMPTGDLGFIDDENYIHLVGRLKDLIIRGGENISPIEIASVITKLDYVLDVKIIGVPHPLLGEEVAAAIIIKPDHQFDKNEIIDFLSDKLAKFKLPAHFVVYEKFPSLQNGKVDLISLKKDLIEKIKNSNC